MRRFRKNIYMWNKNDCDVAQKIVFLKIRELKKNSYWNEKHFMWINQRNFLCEIFLNNIKS